MRFEFARRAAQRQRANARMPVWAGATGAALAALAIAGLPFGAEGLPPQVRSALFLVVAGGAGLAAWGTLRLRRRRRPVAMREAVVECPGCGDRHTDRTPADVCRIASRCPACGMVVPMEPDEGAAGGGARRAI